MNAHTGLDCCDRKADLDRLICRMVAHDSYGAIASAGTDEVHDGKERDDI
jgi:hypothetical protein